MDFLGFSVNATKTKVARRENEKEPGEKMKKIQAEARKLEKEERVSARALSRLIGKMNATSQVIPPTLLFYRHLQISLAQALERSLQNYDTELTLSQECREELRWWDDHMSRWTLIKRGIDLTMNKMHL